MIDFDQMNNVELRAYVLAHREDEQAWNLFMKRLEDDPTVIRIPPSLDEAGWVRVEQLLTERAQADKLPPQPKHE